MIRMNQARHVPAFAVVRIDSDRNDPARDVQLLHNDPGLLIKVVSVWTTEALAVSEVERLNQLNAAKGMWYFWQQTHSVTVGEDET